MPMTTAQRYLLVDDNLADRWLAQEAFEHVCPTCVLTCVDSANAALDLLQNHDILPDVMLLELNLPGMDGFELLEEIKQDARLAQIPVVILTTQCHREQMERAYALRVSAYLVKSLEFDHFVEQLGTLVRYWQINRAWRGAGLSGEY